MCTIVFMANKGHRVLLSVHNVQKLIVFYLIGSVDQGTYSILENDNLYKPFEYSFGDSHEFYFKCLEGYRMRGISI